MTTSRPALRLLRLLAVALAALLALPAAANAAGPVWHRVVLDGPSVVAWQATSADALTQVRVRLDGGPAFTPPADAHGDASALLTEPLPTTARVLQWSGPADVAIRLVDGHGATTAEQADQPPAAPVSHGGSPAPPVVSRDAWGAAAPAGLPRFDRNVRFFVVHHTTGSNDYAEDEAPALVRATQRFHQQVRGWDDLAYHFVVDRYGTIYEGRTGAVVGKPVLGAHAAGFNAGSVGIALLGDFRTAAPPDAMLDALTDLVSWLSDVHHVDLHATSTEISGDGASSRHPAGEPVEVPTVFGHRHTNNTSCPGDVLAAWLTGDADGTALADRALARHPHRLHADVGAIDVLDPARHDGPWSLQVAGTDEVDVTVQVLVDGQVVAESGPAPTVHHEVDLTSLPHGADVRVTATGTRRGTATAAGHDGDHDRDDPAPRNGDVRPLQVQLLVDDPVTRLAGPDRVATAARVSATTFGAADHVVIASARSFPDALVAAPLAARHDAPVLLVDGRLDAAVTDEVARLGARDATIVGGEAAVPAAVADGLVDAGLAVTRLAGPDRFATAAAVADLLAAGSPNAAAAIALGTHPDPARAFPDALSAGRWAAQRGLPLLLTAPDTLPAATAAALARLDVHEGLVLFGGPGAISAAVQDAAADAAAADGVRPPTRRIAGPNRYATSAAAAAEVFDRIGWSADPPDAPQLWVASGTNWPDALAAAAAAHHARAAFVLTDPTTARDEVDALVRQRDVERLVVVGGRAAVDDTPVDVYAAHLPGHRRGRLWAGR